MSITPIIATTQYSTELNNVNWGGSIIGKINHTTTTPLPPFDDFFLINPVRYRVKTVATWVVL